MKAEELEGWTTALTALLPSNSKVEVELAGDFSDDEDAMEMAEELQGPLINRSPVMKSRSQMQIANRGPQRPGLARSMTSSGRVDALREAGPQNPRYSSPGLFNKRKGRVIDPSLVQTGETARQSVSLASVVDALDMKKVHQPQRQLSNAQDRGVSAKTTLPTGFHKSASSEGPVSQLLDPAALRALGPQLARFASRPRLRPRQQLSTVVNENDEAEGEEKGEEGEIEVEKKSSLYKLDPKNPKNIVTGVVLLLAMGSLLVVAEKMTSDLMFSALAGCLLMAAQDIIQHTEHRLLMWVNVLAPSGLGILYGAGILALAEITIEHEHSILLYFLLVTAIGYCESMRLRDQSLSIVATLSGLLIPFMVEEAYDLSLAVAYSTFVIVAVMSIYLLRGWHVLVYCASICCWGCMYVHSNLVLSRKELYLVRAAIFLHWLLYWVASIVRERYVLPSMLEKDAAAHPPKKKVKKKTGESNDGQEVATPQVAVDVDSPGASLRLRQLSKVKLEREKERLRLEQEEKRVSHGISERDLTELPQESVVLSAAAEIQLFIGYRHLLVFNALVLLGTSVLLASTYHNFTAWSGWGLANGFIYLVAAVTFHYGGKRHLSYLNYIPGVALVCVCTWLRLQGDAKYFCMAVEAFAIVLISFYTQDPVGMAFGLLLWIPSLLRTGSTLIFTVPTGMPMINREALLHGAIATMMAVQSHLIDNVHLKLTFEGIVHALLNTWLYREFNHSANGLYATTAMYPALVQLYAYLKVDSEYVTLIRMLFGDFLWGWLFISQTLPRLLFVEPASWLPYMNMECLGDAFVATMGVGVALIHSHRWEGASRWFYLVFCNSLSIGIIFRDAGIPWVSYLIAIAYLLVLFVVGYLFNSTYVMLGSPLTVVMLVLDFFLFDYSDVLWKVTLTVFAGMVVLAIFSFSKAEEEDLPPDPLEQRALHLRTLQQQGSLVLNAQSRSNRYKRASARLDPIVLPRSSSRARLLRSPRLSSTNLS